MEGVRIMTVHKAKGLEFPVVILATCNVTSSIPSRHVDPHRGHWLEPMRPCRLSARKARMRSCGATGRRQ
jgi:ATP-dependent helicase/nuclease subunit A